MEQKPPSAYSGERGLLNGRLLRHEQHAQCAGSAMAGHGAVGIGFIDVFVFKTRILFDSFPGKFHRAVVHRRMGDEDTVQANILLIFPGISGHRLLCTYI